jgi:hypothetical protein
MHEVEAVFAGAVAAATDFGFDPGRQICVRLCHFIS